MNDQNDGVDAVDERGERRKNILWLLTALGLAVLLEGMALVLALTTVLK